MRCTFLTKLTGIKEYNIEIILETSYKKYNKIK